MSDTAEDERIATRTEERRHDPLMSLFIGSILLILLGCVVLMLVANSRPPAGL